MEIIFRTIDGKDFTSEMEARKHERNITEGIKMWDTKGNRTSDVANAIVLSTKDTDCTKMYIQMCKDRVKQHHENDEALANYIGGLCEDDYGMFYWDEGYHWLDNDIICPIIALAKEEGIV